jgi:hypothetical protein
MEATHASSSSVVACQRVTVMMNEPSLAFDVTKNSFVTANRIAKSKASHPAQKPAEM